MKIERVSAVCYEPGVRKGKDFCFHPPRHIGMKGKKISNHNLKNKTIIKNKQKDHKYNSRKDNKIPLSLTCRDSRLE